MKTFVIIVVFAVILVIIASKFFKGGEKKLPFRKKNYFFSEAEKKFYLILKQIADKNGFVIFSKVRLLDLFFILRENDYKARTVNKNKIIQKHIDFLLCDNNTFSPIMGIELDDSSHFLKSREQRDDFVDRVFASAELPLLRVKTSFNYNVNSLEQDIINKINPKPNKS